MWSVDDNPGFIIIIIFCVFVQKYTLWVPLGSPLLGNSSATKYIQSVSNEYLLICFGIDYNKYYLLNTALKWSYVCFRLCYNVIHL